MRRSLLRMSQLLPRLAPHSSPRTATGDASLVPLGWLRKREKPQQNVLQVASELAHRSKEAAERDEVTRQKQKFIPVTCRLLLRRLMAEEGLLSPRERQGLETMAAALDTHFSRQFYSVLEEAKVLYDPLDPDKDTVASRQLGRKELLDSEYRLLRRVERMLDKANFFHIPRSTLIGLLQEHDQEGLAVSIDPAAYDTLQIWNRGSVVAKKTALQNLRKRVNSALSSSDGTKDPSRMYTRVFVAVRTKESGKLHLKIFKNVPCNTLEYLLPNGKIQMSHFDKLFLGSSVMLGAATLGLRFVPVLSDYTTWTWMAAGLAGLVAGRAWIRYKNKRNKYLLNLSNTLYYKTLANNRSVLTLLADRAQDEEFKEAILAYVFLLSPLNRRGVPGTAYTADPPVLDTAASLQARVEEWLGRSFDLQGIDFDVEDALVKLDSLGLLERKRDGMLTVRSMEDALQVLPQTTLDWRTRALSTLLLKEEEEEGEGEGEGEGGELGWR